jgi:hypothetical protein
VKFRLAALLVCASATGCKPGPTTLLLTIDASAGVTVHSLTLHLGLGSADAGVSEALPPSGAVPSLPGRAVVRLPDVAMDIDIALDGQDVDGLPLHAATTVRSVPHEEVTVALTLGATASDGDGGLSPEDAAAPVDEGAPCVPGARCSYSFRRALAIHNGAGAALPAGYTVRVPLDPTLFTAAKTRADLADVRVFGDVPAGEYPRVIDATPPGQTRALWIALAQPIAAGATDTSYSIYYGNAAAATPPSDATQVFPFYDGFDNGTQLSAFWLTNGGPTVAGGMLTLHMNSQDAVTTNAASDHLPTLSALEWRSRITNAASAGQVIGTDTFWSWAGYQHAGDFDSNDPWVIWVMRAATDLHAEREVSTGTCNGGCVGPSLTPDTAYHWFRIERDAATTRFYYDGTLSYTASDVNTVDYSPMIRNYALTSDLNVDWMRGRALASPEPSVTVGAETGP